MKFRTFTTAATTLLGATLIGTGQTQTERRPDNVVGASSREQTSGAAGPSTTTDAAVDAAHGTTDGRSQSTTGATTGGDQESSARSTNSDNANTPGTSGGRSQSTTGAATSAGGTATEGTTTAEQTRAENRAPGDDPNPDQSNHSLAKINQWTDAEKSEVALKEIPESARSTLNSVSAGAEVNEKVTKLTKDNVEVYEARLTRSGQEDLHIFVKADGSVVKTKQKVDLESAPESVRTALREQLGGNDAKPQEIHRVVIDENTSFVATSGKDESMIVVASSGEVIHPGNQQSSDRSATAGSRPGGLQNDRAANRSQQPDAPRPDQPGSPGAPPPPGSPQPPNTPQPPVTPQPPNTPPSNPDAPAPPTPPGDPAANEQ